MAGAATERRASLPILPVHAVTTRPAAPDADAVRIGVITLGCDKNTVDSERILARLLGAGANVSSVVDGADVVIVNTCGFIDIAREESVDALLDAVRLKQEGRIRAVVGMGCLVQRYRDELAAELPEVDLFLGLTEATRLVPELKARGLLVDRDVPIMERPLRVLSTSTPHTSHLKVSEGCDHTCAFCAIPLMRGKHRSTPVDVLMREAQELEAGGVVELNLISQDTTWYGRDLQRGIGPARRGGDSAPERRRPEAARPEPRAPVAGDFFIGRTFAGMAGIDAGATAAQAARPTGGGQRGGLLPELLRALLDATDIPWYRLFYMYPSGITRELVALLAREARLLPYLDMPLQHGSDRILRLMRRPERRSTIRERVRWLRDAVPDLTLRTTVIVGFPGEREDDFEALIDLLEELRFDHVGAFAYSTEENTRAATLPDPVPESLKRERLERLLDVQRGISLERNEAWIGREEMVLVDAIIGRDPGGDARTGQRGAVARTRGQALEVDGVVHLADAAGARAGEFVPVRITDALEDDLVAERIGS